MSIKAFLKHNFTDVIIAIVQTDDTKRQIARTKWQEDQHEMKRMLQKAAEIAYLEGLVDGDTKQKYHLSGKDIDSDKHFHITT